MLTTLAGIVIFFMVEKILRIPHMHSRSRQSEPPSRENVPLPGAILILIGDGFHNFVDGAMIATSFLVTIPLGILTTFAVIAHEIPQELGDFIILLEGGLSRKKAYWLNALSASTTLVGALLTYSIRTTIEE